MEKQVFGRFNNQEVVKFILENKLGTQVHLINYGAIISKLYTKDYTGNSSNIILGFDSLDEYIADTSCHGAIVGRYANRIANAQFSIDGNEHNLAKNDGNNNLHGGYHGFHKKVWSAKIIGNNHVKLSYHSADLEEGFPGKLSTTVDYMLTEQNELQILMQAKSDAITPVNLTGHTYFNLTGNSEESVLNHHLCINADNYTPVNKELIPHGTIERIKNTALDFSSERPIAEQFQQLPNGFDHNYVLNKNGQAAARLFDPKSKRTLEVFTNKPGMQFYTGNYLDGKFSPQTGLCLEPQFFPDSPNQPQFPSPFVAPGETYEHRLIYRFGLAR